MALRFYMVMDETTQTLKNERKPNGLMICIYIEETGTIGYYIELIFLFQVKNKRKQKLII